MDPPNSNGLYRAARMVRDRLTLIAFYADCHHQVKPVTEGYRVALTYNLVLENAGIRTPFPALDARSLEGLSKGLGQYFSPAATEDGNSTASAPGRAASAHRRPRKWIYLLDYQYTRKGLDWRRLKHQDQARVDALTAVAESMDLEAHLALAEIRETWDCVEEFEDWDHSYSHRGYWQASKRPWRRHRNGCVASPPFGLNSCHATATPVWPTPRSSWPCGSVRPNWRELNRFLQLRSQDTLAWPIRKDRRRHIHTIIDGMGIPVTHVTRRQGSPFTLVLTKTKRLFELDRKALQQAGKTLAELRKIVARHHG